MTAASLPDAPAMPRAPHGDVALVALVMAVLVVLFLPIPAGVLDVLLLANFSFAFLLLLLTFYMARPVEFSTFPSLLLIATLFRLSLNVAATRLILADADAGKVISAIGGHVVGGNYVIGFVVFLILIVVQYVVVTNGAQRVSEVAARFTLDSMPGQQMSIDADLNMGFIDQAEAQRRRRNLEREAAFYGAMDGASKFVKGDAIAGILILGINVVGGMLVGVMQHGMRWADALRTYTLLTIGDGIVTQVPALVIAVGTGILVTRSASDGNLGREVVRQVTSFPKTLALVGIALLALALLPGMPAAPAVVLLAVLAGVLLWVRRVAADVPAPASDAGTPGSDGPTTAGEDPYEELAVEPIEIHVDPQGARWAAEVGDLTERIAAFRRQYALEAGFVLPRVRLHEDPALAARHYEILVDGVVVGRGEVRPGRLLAIHPAGNLRSVPGEATRDPTYGLPALWIEPRERDVAQDAGYTLVDPATVLMTHLAEVLRRESATLLTRAETERLLDRVRRIQPTLVEELIPTVLSVTEVQRVLQGLLREKVSIRHVEAILETLTDAGRQTRDPALLVERVRQRLGAAICQGLAAGSGALHVLTLEPETERRLIGALRAGDAADAPAFDPALTEQFMARLLPQCERMMKGNLLPVLLCTPDLRRHLRALSERVLPHLRVLAMTEVPHALELRSFAVVDVSAPRSTHPST